MTENLFCPAANGIAVNATAAGTAVDITSGIPSGTLSDVLWLYNTSAQLVRVRMGSAATSASFPVPAGEMQPFRVGSYSTLGLWSASTVQVEIFRGDGL